MYEQSGPLRMNGSPETTAIPVGKNIDNAFNPGEISYAAASLQQANSVFNMEQV
jgi:hypothetical protein